MEWLKFTAWPWIRDSGIPLATTGIQNWFDLTMEYPGVAAFNVILGAIIAAMLL